MNKKYWEKYYKTHKEDEPSPFAQWAELVFPRNTTVLDIGAGNLRDTKYFEEKGHYVYPVDQVLERDIEALIKSDRKVMVAYLRWIIHAIEPKLAAELIEWVKTHARFIFIETRTVQDTTFDDSHERYPVDSMDLLNKLAGTRLMFVKQGYNLSKTEKSDPHLIRVVCETIQS